MRADCSNHRWRPKKWKIWLAKFSSDSFVHLTRIKLGSNEPTSDKPTVIRFGMITRCGDRDLEAWGGVWFVCEERWCCETDLIESEILSTWNEIQRCLSRRVSGGEPMFASLSSVIKRAQIKWSGAPFPVRPLTTNDTTPEGSHADLPLSLTSLLKMCLLWCIKAKGYMNFVVLAGR